MHFNISIIAVPRLILCTFLLINHFQLVGQSVEWVYFEPGMSEGDCLSESDCDDNASCFLLKYTPGLSGTLTSYTMGFLGNCIDSDVPIYLNTTCTMTNNSEVINGCESLNSLLLIASGNNGDLEITSGIPLYLGQVCLSTTSTDSIFLTEDEITGLTVSIDSALTGNGVTDLPVFQESKLYHKTCSCSIEWISGSTNQSLSCFEEMDTIYYLSTDCSDVSVSGLTGNLYYTWENDTIKVFGNLNSTGSTQINVNGDSGCNCNKTIDLSVIQGSAIMISNRCFLTFQDAIDDYNYGELIEIMDNVITHPPVPVLTNENVQVNEGVVWEIRQD